MSRTVDSRIVEMKFDNKQFESGAKQTMSTLSRLKEALKLPESTKSLEGLNKATKNVDLKGISAGIEVLEKRFSTMGIVGMRVIENITDGLMGKLNSAFNFVNDAIISGGIRRAMNIEKAHFQLQALLKDETKVQAVMDDAMKSVDGTAYAYDEAAKAASQFAATGLQAGEEMLRALTGITGVAAMTNSEYEGISMIFTTIAGQGRVMADQLNQLAARGLNAASTVAEWFREVQGQSEMTEAAVREMVSDGQISFKMFAEAMGWAFGESAQRANETFTGALSNVKAALARIGAGFISPLVEQNGEMVKLFNSLRIKINEVKSALVFDEQTSAVSGLAKQSDLLNESVSRLVKSGQVGLQEFTDVIIATTRTEEELAISNEILADSYERVKEAGYASAETFAEFNSQGINAGKAVRDYMNGVLDGSIKASKGVKDAITDVTQGAQVMVGDIGKYAQEGKISYDIFTDAIVWGSGKIESETSFTKDVIKKMMAEVKESGSVTMDTLAEFNKNNMNATSALREYLNGVENGSIRASYAVTEAVHTMTNGVMVGTENIIELAKEGTITYEVFQAAMEHAYGDQTQTLSKRFTDAFLDQIKKITTAINNADLSKPIELFGHGVNIAINLLKGLLSVLKPVGSAFSDVFLAANPDVLIDLAKAIEEFTSKLRLSEKGSKELHDTMKGLFDVVKLVVDGFIKLVSSVLPVGTLFAGMSSEMSGGILGIAGSMGRMLSSFTEMIRSSETISLIFDKLSSLSGMVGEGFSGALVYIQSFVKQVSELPAANRVLTSLKNTFLSIGTSATDYLRRGASTLGDFAEKARMAVPQSTQDLFSAFKKKVTDLSDELNKLNFTRPSETFKMLGDKIKELLSSFDNVNGLSGFVDKVKEFGNGLKDAFSIDGVLSQIERVKEVLGGFVDWLKDKLGPAFSDFSVGPAIAGAGGIGIIYSIIKLAKMLGSITKPFNALASALGGVKDALTAYQQNLKADSILKVAEAIAVLAVALAALTLVDPDKLMNAAKALSLVSAVMLGGIALIKKFTKEGGKVTSALEIFASQLGSALNKLASAVRIKLLGSAIKDFAISVGIIAAAIAGLGYMYSKDSMALEAGFNMVGYIAAGVTGMMIAMSLIGSVAGNGMKAFQSAAFGVLALCGGLILVVMTMNKLFKMDFPPDWQDKLKVLAALLAGLGALSVVVGFGGRLGGGNDVGFGSIIALTVMLIATVSQLDKLFKMDFPPDWQTRLVVLGLIFGELAGVIIALGIAGMLAGGKIEAAGSILAMSVLLGAITTALMVLTLAPFDKLMAGAVSLGVVLVAVGAALFGAAQISEEGVGEAVMGMAAVIGAIAAALGVLAMVSWQGLLKAVITLSSVMGVIAGVFIAISKIESEAAGPVVEAMANVIGAIAATLVILAQQPWPNLLAAAVSLSGVLVALGFVFKQLGEIADDIDVDKIAIFMLATSILLPITLAIGTLSEQPWEGLLAAGAALSAVIAAYGLIFVQVTKTDPDLQSMGIFLLGTLALLPIALAIGSLVEYPWEGLLAAGTAISEVLLSMSAVMAVCTLVGNASTAAIQGLGVFLIFIAALTAVVLALGAILQNDAARRLLSGGLEGLVQIGTGIGEFVGSIVSGAIKQISSILPQIGQDLSDFMTNLTPFIIGSKMLDAGSVACVGFLAGVIIALTVAEVINGITKLLSFGRSSFVDMADQLSEFMLHLTPFIVSSKMLKEEQMKACQYIAQMVLMLTTADLLAGITKFLGLSGGITQFGEELEAFGPYIRKFAEEVKDVKPEAVEGAAAAAEIMATMAKKLPAQSGLATAIFGKHSLAEFGAELLTFGPSIKAFSVIVADVKPEAVEGAAAAAEIMATLATKLPAQGGLVSKIFGEKNLSVFGQELVSFGLKMKMFAGEVKDLNPATITSVSIMTAIMSELANNLPSTTSLWDKLFGGGAMSISKFGDELLDFGKSMTKFSKSVEGISLSSMKGAVEAFKELITLSEYIKGKEASQIADFAKELENMGSKGIDSFIKSFNAGKPKVKTAITSLFGVLNSSIRDEAVKANRNMKDNAAFIVSGLTNGLSNQTASVRQASANLASAVDSSVKSKLEIHSPSRLARERGQQYGEGLELGLNQSSGDVKKAAEGLGTAVDDGLATSITISGKSATKFGKTLKSIVDTTEDSLIEIDNVVSSRVGGIGESMSELGEAITGNLESSLDLTNISWNVQMTMSEIARVGGESASAMMNWSEIFSSALNISRETSLVLKGLMIEDENAYWNELLAIKRAGADAEKYQEMELEDFKKETLETAKQIYDDYVTEFESTKDRVVSAFDLFTEVTEKEAKSKDELVKILESQLTAYDEFTETIQSLYTRLEGRQLLEYLKDLGVDSLDQLKVMNEMTDEELDAYAALYDEKLAKANEIATFQMGEMKANTEQELNDLFGMMYGGFDIDKFTNMYDGSIESVQTYVDKVMVPMEELGQKIYESTVDIGKQIVAGTTAGIEEYASDLGSLVSGTITDALEGQDEVAKLAASDIGLNLGEGILEGMKGIPGTETVATEMMGNIAAALKMAGEIHSPSELTKREVGVALAQGIVEGLKVDPEGLTTAARGLITTIMDALKSGKDDLMDSVKGMMNDVIKAMFAEEDEVEGGGSDMIEAMMSGMRAKTAILMNTVEDICVKIVSEFKRSLPGETFRSIGDVITSGLNQGITSKRNSTVELCKEISSQIITAFKENLTESIFKGIGEDVGEGLRNGIESKIDDIAQAAIAAAKAAVKAAKDELDINSPSKVFSDMGENISEGTAIGINKGSHDLTEAFGNAVGNAVYSMKETLGIHSPSTEFEYIGENITEGLILGMVSKIKLINDATSSMGEEAANGVQNAISRSMSLIDSLSDEIVIAPIVDLGNVARGIDDIAAMFNRTFDISPTYDRAVAAAGSFQTGGSSYAQNRNTSLANGNSNTYTFTQNNYSPKALSRVDIYRQTKNQFASFKKAVGGA